MGVGGGGALPGHFFYFTREMESFILFSPQDRLYFHHALWPFIYFTHFSHTNIYFQKVPLQYSNGGISYFLIKHSAAQTEGQGQASRVNII